jgi:curved DNA-binding protein CbpA
MSKAHRAEGLPLQGEMFADSEQRASGAALVSVVSGATPLSEAQRTFNRLTEKILRERDTLAAWDAYMARYRGRVAGELQALERELRGAQRRLVQCLDELLCARAPAERLSGRQRAKVRSLLLEIVGDLLQEGPDAALEALYEKHGTVSHAELRRQDMAAAEALIGEVFGAEALEGHEARDVEELFRHASARAAGRAKAEHAARRARPAGQQQGAGRKAQAAREASGSVREIYRRLASALHPDRETDGAERERKTRMMQRANQAYERDDLLDLLALQIEIEQIDAAELSSVPEERLHHYNEVLREQLRALQTQVEERAEVFRLELGLTGPRVTPRDVDQALDARMVQARTVRGTLERYLEALRDARLRRSFIKGLPDPQDDEMPGPDDIAAFAAMLRSSSPQRRPGADRRRSNKRKRQRP